MVPPNEGTLSSHYSAPRCVCIKLIRSLIRMLSGTHRNRAWHALVCKGTYSFTPTLRRRHTHTHTNRQPALIGPLAALKIEAQPQKQVWRRHSSPIVSVTKLACYHTHTHAHTHFGASHRLPAVWNSMLGQQTNTNRSALVRWCQDLVYVCARSAVCWCMCVRVCVRVWSLPVWCD